MKYFLHKVSSIHLITYYLIILFTYIFLPTNLYSQTLRHQKVREAFRKYRTSIIEMRTDCWDAAIILGDLNRDGRPDGIVAYGCGVPIGQRSPGGVIGWAVFINVNESYRLLYKEENGFQGLMPRRIYKNGLISAERYEYNAYDLPNAPTVIKPKKLKFDGKKLSILK